MKNLFIILIVLFISGCGDENIKIEHQDKNSSSPYFDDENFVYNPEMENSWYEDSIAKINKNLIGFKFTIASKEQYEELEQTILLPYEKSDKKILRTELEIVEKGDSILVSFWQQHIISCRTKGNIEINDKTINLLFADICSPYSEVVGEIALINLQFILQKNKETENKKFEVKGPKYSYEKLLKK